MRSYERYHIIDGYLFFLIDCIPKCSLREVILQEYHNERMKGYFGREKILFPSEGEFLWPMLIRDGDRHVKQ